jgi:hypothetical protein
LSNILERDTGREHLNFGTGGDFSPLQYALLYKTLASNFDHTQVLVGVLPDNDFYEMDPSWGKKAEPGRYRPYYANDLSVFYMGHFQPNASDGVWDQIEAWMRAYLASYHVGQYISTRYKWRMPRVFSGYNDYTDTDLIRLKKSLQDIKSTADMHGARLAVFLIPPSGRFQAPARGRCRSTWTCDGELGERSRDPHQGSVAGDGRAIQWRLQILFFLL